MRSLTIILIATASCVSPTAVPGKLEKPPLQSPASEAKPSAQEKNKPIPAELPEEEKYERNYCDPDEFETRVVLKN